MAERGLRFAAVDNYIVFYIPDIETQTVTILRVMYSGRNIDEQLTSMQNKEGRAITDGNVKCRITIHVLQLNI